MKKSTSQIKRRNKTIKRIEVKQVVKDILKFIIAIASIAGMLLLFFTFTLPALKKDLEITVEQELELHTQTLEKIKQDFSYVLSNENVSAEIGKNILLTISGKACELKVELNRELSVLSLETVNTSQDAFVGPIFACIGELIVVLFDIVWLCFIIRDIADDISIAKDRRRTKKLAKKQKVDVEVVV